MSTVSIFVHNNVNVDGNVVQSVENNIVNNVENQMSNRTVIHFLPLSDSDGLPFPLNLYFHWRIILAFLFLVVLLKGAKLRLTIVSFIKSPETKLGPINYLILMDQINGLFLALNIIFRIGFVLSPEPMSKLLGIELCYLANFSGAIYIGGGCIWSCYIALFRVVFIKGQTFLKKIISIKSLLHFLIFFGGIQIVVFAISFLILDDKNSTMKMCTHSSNMDIEIMEAYRVKSLPNYLK
jgi:hypothetical protein